MSKESEEYTTEVKTIFTYADGFVRTDVGEIGSLRHRGFSFKGQRPINISLPIIVQDFECVKRFYQALHPLKGSLTFRMSERDV